MQGNPSQLVKVVVVEEHVASGELAVTTGAANLLNIVLNAARHVVVNDGLDVGLVDTHAEGDSAAEYSNSVADELFLGEGALFVRLSRVV